MLNYKRSALTLPEVLNLVVVVFELVHIVTWHILQQLVEFLQKFSFFATRVDSLTVPLIILPVALTTPSARVNDSRL